MISIKLSTQILLIKNKKNVLIYKNWHTYIYIYIKYVIYGLTLRYVINMRLLFVIILLEYQCFKDRQIP